MALLVCVLLLPCAAPAMAQKSGGILKLYHRDSPGSLSILEEATISAIAPAMAVFNNLVLFNQHEKQNRPEFIEPELAESWSWNDDYTKLSFKLRQGVKWHDGQPFTAKDVKCTWDLLTGKSTDKLRLNPRKVWYENLDDVVVEGDYAVTFVLKRPQPAFLMLLASGDSPVYPCHVPAAQMRTHPIGTGPFKFVDYKPNEYIKFTKNTDYWKPGRPYLDGVEWTIIPNRATQSLAFIAGQFDMTFPYEVTVQMVHDIKSQAPSAICEIDPTMVSFNLLVNRDKPPFNDPDIRQAMMLTIDRKAFLDIISEGQGQIGGAMQSPPPGLWGLPPDILQTMPGYGPDVEKNRADARALMEKHGYGPEQPTCGQGADPQHRPIPRSGDHPDRPVEADLHRRRTRCRRDRELVPAHRAQGLHGRRQPDRQRRRRSRRLFLRALRLRLGAQLHQLLQSRCRKAVCQAVGRSRIQTKRKKIVWDIDKILTEDGARPIVYRYNLATCHYPRVHNITTMVNSIFNGWRFEDAWLDQ